MNRTGISSACYYPAPTELAFDKICRSGARCAEIFFNSPSEIEKGFIREMSVKQKAFGVEIVSIHPFTSFLEDSFLFSPYERRFHDTLPLYERYCEVCKTLGASVLVIHGARTPIGNSGLASDELYCERFAKLTELGKPYGVRVCQENVARHRSESAAYLKMMRQAIGEDFGVVLDIKQTRRAKITPYDVIDAVGDCIRHVHISDYRADCDCLPPFSGLFDFAEFFQTMRGIGYSGAYIVEIYEHSYREEREIVESYQKVQDLLLEQSKTM